MPASLQERLQEVALPVETRPVRILEPVGGKDFGTTAVMPDLQTVIDYEENACRVTWGYYRMVDRPALHQLQQQLSTLFGVQRTLLFNSAATALREGIDFLLTRRPDFRLCWHLESPLPRWLEAWQLCEEDDPHLPCLHLIEAPTVDQLPQLRAQHGVRTIDWVIWHSNTLPEQELPIGGHEWWVSDLDLSQQVGGALLGQHVALLDELFALRKKRGPILSLRNLAAWRQQQQLPENALAIREAVREKLRHWEQARACFLFPSGMNAMTTALELCRRRCRSHKAPRFLAIGLLYTDTYALLMQERWRGGSGAPIFLNTDELERLPRLLKDDSIAAIVTETITNPLSEVPDLRIIHRAAEDVGVPVVVDNTLAGPLNAQPLVWKADLVVHSTAKYLSGNNRQTGGALLVREADWEQEIQAFQEEWQNEMSPWEVVELEHCLRTFPQRMQRFNRNGKVVGQFLAAHPKVQRVHFNGLKSHPHSGLAQRLFQGSGSLISFILRNDSADGLARFYNADLRPIHKAPGLGSDETMLCPYALLAHYHASEAELRELRISRYLVRLAVGCEEDLTPILEALERGLNA